MPLLRQQEAMNDKALQLVEGDSVLPPASSASTSSVTVASIDPFLDTDSDAVLESDAVFNSDSETDKIGDKVTSWMAQRESDKPASWASPRTKRPPPVRGMTIGFDTRPRISPESPISSPGVKRTTGTRSHQGKILKRHQSEASGLVCHDVLEVDEEPDDLSEERHISRLIRQFERLSMRRRHNTSETSLNANGGGAIEEPSSLEPSSTSYSILDVDGSAPPSNLPQKKRAQLFAEARRISHSNNLSDTGSPTSSENNNNWHMGYKRKTCIVRLDGCRYTIGEFLHILLYIDEKHS